MKNTSFKHNPEFWNFLYHAVNDKLHDSIANSELQPSPNFEEDRMSRFWGDFFEQVLGIGRTAVLEEAYGKLSHFLKPGLDPNEPSVSEMLYYAELANRFGSDEVEFDEIYPIPTSTR